MIINFHCSEKNLVIADRMIKFDHPPTGFAIDEKWLIILFEDPLIPCFNKGSGETYYRFNPVPNNIDAYDHSGNKLWNIKSIIKKSHKCDFLGESESNDVYNSVRLISNREFPEDGLDDTDLKQLNLKDNQSYLYCYGRSGRVYIIDLEEEEVIFVKGFK